MALLSHLPTFIVVGAQKSGTSTIYAAMREHPSVLAADWQEVHFFNSDRFYGKGLKAYARQFRAKKQFSCVGEVTPGYMISPDVPARIARDIPGCKIVFCLRDPLERAYSAWRMQIWKGVELDDFSTAIRADEKYLDHSRYHFHISKYLEQFPREDILIMWFEDLKADSQGFLSDLFTFVGAPATEIPVPARENVGGAPRRRIITRILNSAYRARNYLQTTPFGPLVDNMIVDRAARRLRNAIVVRNRTSERSVAGPSPEDISYFVEQLQDDIDALSSLTGRDLSHWLAPRS
jgi:hypothetical protein